MKARQRVRRGILLISLLLFPAIYYYFSPYLILMGASEGVASGSMLVFGAMFLVSLFLGRGFCGWICPAGGIGEAAIGAQPKPARGVSWVKWLFWVPWIAMMVLFAVKAGGLKRADFFYATDHGLSLTSVMSYVIYYAVLTLVVSLSFVLGRRGFCHAACWMAPFMTLGHWFRRMLRIPSLHYRVKSGDCIHCHACTEHCPMSLPVETMVAKGSMLHRDCIYCGECADGCPKKVFRFSFGIPTREKL